MNSIWLILLLLFCCNGDNGFGRNGCGCSDDLDCGCDHRDSRDSDCGCEHRDSRDSDCGCERGPERGNYSERDYDMRSNPFSPLNRRERMESDYSTFRGNNGPCGCEENDD